MLTELRQKTITQRVLLHLRGKYIKRMLLELEKQNLLTPTLRKIILDGMNDFTRDVEKELGY